MSKPRIIDIRPSIDEVFAGPNVHDIRFSLDGVSWHTITLTTRELRSLRRKIGIYLKTMESEYESTRHQR